MLLPGFETPILRDWIDDLIAGSGGSDATTKNVQTVDVDGPNGYGKYVLNPDGTLGAFIGSTIKPSSGGSSVSVNIPVQNQGGRYITAEDTSGAITGIPGAVYQQDTYDGSISIVSKPSAAAANVNPADKNNDGLDDTTNMALGVYRDPNSPSGYSYGMGQPVYPNGAPYSGPMPAPDAPDTISVGGRPYIWDGQQFIPAPGIPNTPSSGSSSSTSGIFTPGRSTSGGGGSSSSRDYLGEIAARADADAGLIQARLAADKELAQMRADLDWQMFQARMALENDPNSIANQATLRRLQMEQDALQTRMIDSFRSAVSDVDPAAFRAMLFAQGLPAGGNIANRLSEGGNALSDAANAGAAALLAKIRTPTQIQWQQVAGLPPVGQTPSGTQPTQTPTTGLPPSTPAQGLPTANVPNQEIINWQNRVMAENAKQQVDPAQQAFDDFRNPANWTDVGSGMRNTVTGDMLSYQAYGEARAQETASDPNFQNQFWAGASVEPNYGGLNASSGYYWKPVSDLIGTSSTNHDPLGQLSGTAIQYVSPDLPNYAYAQPQLQSTIFTDYGNDGGAAGGPNLAQEPLPYRTVVPMAARGLSRGGGMPMPDGREAAIVGDLQHPMQRGNPEMVVGDNLEVVPMNMMSQGGRMMARGLPRMAYGSWNPYSFYTNMFSPWMSTTTQPTTTTGPAPTTTAPAPYTAPQPTSTTTPYTAPTTTTPTSTTPTTTTAPTPTAATTTTPTTTTPTTPTPTPTTTTTTPTTPAPETQQTVPTASGELITTDPVSAAQIEEIRDWRMDQLDPMFAEIGPYSLQLADQGPSFQQGYLQNLQTARGIPAADFAHEIAKWRLRGLSREAMLAGTGR